MANFLSTIAGAAGKAVGNAIRNVANSLGFKGSSVFDSGNYAEQKYNDNYHLVDLYLENSGDFKAPQRYHINPAAVQGLMIRDTVNDWVTDGSMTFFYLPEKAPDKNETGQNKSTFIGSFLKAAKENGKALDSYNFRGDGYDLLRVMVMPKSAPGPYGDGVAVNQNNTKWMLSYVFSIYDVEDVNEVPALQGMASAFMKCLKVHFHDVRYQMLQTINLEYSTSTPKDTALVPNFESEIAKKMGVLYTGDVMRDILNEALAKPENGGCPEFKVEETNWDKGKGEIFYTSPAQYTAHDDLEYVYSNHVSTKELKHDTELSLNDLCMLHTNRGKKFGDIEELHLTSLMDFFEKAGSGASSPGELQKEHFFVTSHTGEKTATNLHRAPIGGNATDIDLKTFKYGQIISYSFVDMSPSVNSNLFCSAPVYSVDIGKREFNIEFKGNDIETVRKTIAKSYISKLYKEGNEEKLFLPTIHKSKKDLNMFPNFSLNSNNPVARLKNSFHTLLYTGLFQNACICFKTYGLTLRESGTFIGIDKTDGCNDNDFNNKLFGQWFVVQVNHLFEAGAYMNEIYAVKLHRFKEASEQFKETL